LKQKFIIGLLALSWVLAGALIYLHKDRVQLIKLPPESLAEWYKPQNKRHVWLHNMFKLRREMQAIGHYAALEQAEPLALWAGRLNEHYQEIRKMVPEWGGRLDQDSMQRLLNAQQENQYEKIDGLLSDLQKSCDACHTQFRTIAATLYRSPDFTQLRVKNSESLAETMESLNVQVNNIKIAVGANDQAWALNSLADLKTDINDMGALCESCHSYLPKRYPDAVVETALSELHTALVSGDQKQQGEALGKVAVSACAQCHGTHRIAYDTQQLINAETGFIELFRH
jgi:cytochrome c556